jgi:predicted nucleotidyltransferase
VCTVQLAEVTDGLMAEIVRRIVDALDPDRIILFGSFARGDARRDSDIDLLVIKSGVTDVHDAAYRARAAVGDIVRSFDILVRTPEDFARYSQWLGCVMRDIAREGKTLYERSVAATR